MWTSRASGLIRDVIRDVPNPRARSGPATFWNVRDVIRDVPDSRSPAWTPTTAKRPRDLHPPARTCSGGCRLLPDPACVRRPRLLRRARPAPGSLARERRRRARPQARLRSRRRRAAARIPLGSRPRRFGPGPTRDEARRQGPAVRRPPGRLRRDLLRAEVGLRAVRPGRRRRGRPGRRRAPYGGQGGPRGSGAALGSRRPRPSGRRPPRSPDPHQWAHRRRVRPRHVAASGPSAAHPRRHRERRLRRRWTVVGSGLEDASAPGDDGVVPLPSGPACGADPAARRWVDGRREGHR